MEGAPATVQWLAPLSIEREHGCRGDHSFCAIPRGGLALLGYCFSIRHSAVHHFQIAIVPVRLTPQVPILCDAHHIRTSYPPALRGTMTVTDRCLCEGECHDASDRCAI